MSKLANTEKSAAARVSNAKVMNRLELRRRLIAPLKGDEAVIGAIGNTNFDLRAAGQRPQNFYMLGSMGLAFPIALGVAIAQPQRRVIALEGDGSLPMQFGCLAVRIDDSPGVGKPVRDPAQIRERFMRGIGVRA